MSRRADEALASEQTWAQERAELQRGAKESLEEAVARTAEELRRLRLKLDAEVQARRVAHKKMAQFQREMAGYRQNHHNPATLREAEEQLAKRLQELTAAEEQVRNLTQELRDARAAGAQQDERAQKLRWFADELKKK